MFYTMKGKHIVRITALVLMLSVALFGFAGCKEKQDDARSSYTIAATLDAEEMTLSASCKIHYVNRTDVELNEVWFHLYPAAYRDGAHFTPVTAGEIDSAYPGGVSYGGIEIVSVEGGEYAVAGQDEDILVVTLANKIMPTQSADITVNYTLKIPRMRHRFGYENGTVNLGNWYPVECAYDNGFVGSPYYSYGDPFNLPVCDYNVTITAPAKYTVAMSGKTERSESEGTAVTHAALKKARDFAVVLGEFQTLTQSVGGTQITYFYKNDDKAQEHLQAACASLAYFSSAFGAYPYETYSVVQTPFNQGGMEYTGLVYVSDAVTDKMITEVIVHETAHQWWYGLVGNDQINSAWMDEALAEYSTTLFYKNNPEFGVTYDARIADAMGGFSLYCELSKCSDTSMERSLADFASSAEYSYMTYVKGQLMYDSLNKMVGEDKLIGGLRCYVNKCSYTTAKPDDLIACLEQTSKRNLKPFVTSFLDGSAKLYSIS